MLGAHELAMLAEVTADIGGRFAPGDKVVTRRGHEFELRTVKDTTPDCYLFEDGGAAHRDMVMVDAETMECLSAVRCLASQFEALTPGQAAHIGKDKLLSMLLAVIEAKRCVD